MAPRGGLRAKLFREGRARANCLLFVFALLPWACSDQAVDPALGFEVTPGTVTRVVGQDFSITIRVAKARLPELGISFGAEILVTDSTSGSVVTKPTADDVTGTGADALVGGDPLEITEFDVGIPRTIEVAYLCDSPGETRLTVNASIGEFADGALRMDENHSDHFATVAVTCTLGDPTPGPTVTESLPASGGSLTVNEATVTLDPNPMGYEFTVTDLGRPPIEGAELGSNLYDFTSDPSFPLPPGTFAFDPPPNLGDCPSILRVVDGELHDSIPRFPTGVVDGKPTCQMLRSSFALEQDSSCTTVRVTPAELTFEIKSGAGDCTDLFESITIENLTNQELSPSLAIDSAARDIIEPHPDIAAGVGPLAAGETGEYKFVVSCPRTTAAEGWIVAGKSPEFVQLIPFTIVIQ